MMKPSMIPVNRIIFSVILALILLLSSQLSFISSTKLFVHRRRSDLINNITGIVKLCLESEPDGVAVLSDNSKTDVVLLFKVNKFWLITVEELHKLVKSNQRVPRFGLSNHMTAKEIFPEMPSSPDYVISFSGLPPADPFYNNFLVFKEQSLYRYQATTIQLGKADVGIIVQNITGRLVGKHTTKFWHEFPVGTDVQFMAMPRESRLLLTRHVAPPIWFSYASSFVLTEGNIDNPIHHKASSGSFPFSLSTIRFVYELPNEEQSPLSFLTNGDVCFKEDCLKLKRLMECNPEVDVFMESFAYWLWRETDLTLRIILIALSSIMVVNFTLATSFIYHQLTRISDLT